MMGELVPVDVRGQLFKSVKACAEHFGVDPATVSRHLTNGTQDRLGLTQKFSATPMKFDGVLYPSQSAAVKGTGRSVTWVKYRLDDGAYLQYLHHKGDLRQSWFVVGPLGAIEIWASPYVDGAFSQRFYGGVEVHSYSPLYPDQSPLDTTCHLLGQPCYCDGSSLYFSEHIERHLPNEGDPISETTLRYLQSELCDWYARKFKRPRMNFVYTQFEEKTTWT